MFVPRDPRDYFIMKVNLGCGSEILEGWVNIDVRPLPGVDVVCDLKDLSQFEDGSWDECRMSHVIEHFTEPEAISILGQVFCKLKKGGKLEVYCPDAMTIAWYYVHEELPIKEFSRLLFGNQAYPEELHKLALDSERLANLVYQIGFKVTSYNPRPNAYPYDLGVQAVKP